MNNWAIWIPMGAIGIFQWGPPVTHPPIHPGCNFGGREYCIVLPKPTKRIPLI